MGLVMVSFWSLDWLLFVAYSCFSEVRVRVVAGSRFSDPGCVANYSTFLMRQQLEFSNVPLYSLS